MLPTFGNYFINRKEKLYDVTTPKFETFKKKDFHTITAYSKLKYRVIKKYLCTF
jgi:hypothetical protein